MGSDSDWRVMAAPANCSTSSASPTRSGWSRRTGPRSGCSTTAAAAGRGLRVIIAGAGGAAHLPGMVASATVLPVIGVPVPLATLDGMDSLLSIVQMPAGIPVALRLDRRRTQRGSARGADPGQPPPDDAALALRLAGFADDLQATVLAKHDALRERSGH